MSLLNFDNIQFLNLIDNTFVSNLIQTGGAFDKYILLSCNEFNNTVDQIIQADGQMQVINYNFGNNEESVQIDNLIEHDQNFQIIDENKFKIFLKEIGIKDEDIKKIINGTHNDHIKYREFYMRKINNYETRNFYRGFINWKNYPDKTPDIKMNSSTVSKLRGSKIIYFAYFSFNESSATPIIDQLLFLNSLNHYGVAEINIVLPYFPLGTMERIVGEGETPTGYALANMLNSIPSGASKNNIYIFDIHALCSRFFFHTNTIPILITLMPAYLKYINDAFPETNPETNFNSNLNIIVFPDDGAKKRFEKLIPSNFKTITCSKTRIGDNRIVKIDQGDIGKITKESETFTVKGESRKIKMLKNNKINLFIVDDLVQSGGTLLETINGLQEIFKREYALSYDPAKIKFFTLVTHSVFPDDANITKFFSDDKVSQLITSDSRPLRAKYLTDNQGAKVEIIKISEILYNIFTSRDGKSNYVAPFSIN
jgi:phosphoribosylpyrophosphate synthetase